MPVVDEGFSFGLMIFAMIIQSFLGVKCVIGMALLNEFKRVLLIKVFALSRKLGHPHTIDDAGMVLLVRENLNPRAHQGPTQALIGSISRAKHEGSWAVLEAGELAFQLIE